MAYPKTYEVIGGEAVYDTPPGGKFTLEAPVTWKHNPDVSWLNEQALIDGGMVRLVSQGKEHCEVCKETGTKKAAAEEYTAKQLAEHYAQVHPAHEAPKED